MKNSKLALQNLLNMLEGETLFSLSQEEREALRKESERLFERLSTIESDLLTVGLLGGTGVGKSTLMNALAGRVIASTSHRRPHTDAILIYRHEDAGIPQKIRSSSIPWREISHSAEAVKQILLCDMPDFDSFVRIHQERVTVFLEHLDILVWVISPEKYGDRRFYEVLEQTAKADQNFCFLLNKADLLFQGGTLEKGYEDLAKVIDGLRQHASGSGVREPVIYAVSAQEILDGRKGSPWNQFASFRQQIFQQRSLKEVRSIKAANLDVEVGRLLAFLDKERDNLERFARLLEDSVADFRKHAVEWQRTGQAALRRWLARGVAEAAASRYKNPAALVGPGYAVGLLLGRQRSVSGDDAVCEPPEPVLSDLRGRLEWLEDRISRRILSENLPGAFQTRLHDAMDVEGAGQQLSGAIANTVEGRLARPRSAGVLWRFKAVQWFAYLVLSALLVIALGGEAAWRGFIEEFGWRTAARLCLSIIETLFSPVGLAALGSYAVLCLFAALRFFRTQRRMARRGAAAIVKAIEEDLAGIFDGAGEIAVNRLKTLVEEIRSRKSALSDLDRPHPKGPTYVS